MHIAGRRKKCDKITDIYPFYKTLVCNGQVFFNCARGSYLSFSKKTDVIARRNDEAILSIVQKTVYAYEIASSSLFPQKVAGAMTKAKISDILFIKRRMAIVGDIARSRRCAYTKGR
jgi:hypothetical protein